MGKLGVGRDADDLSVDGLESLERLVEREDLGGADDYIVSIRLDLHGALGEGRGG